MQFFRNKKLFIFFIGFILLIVLIGYTLKDRTEVTFGEGIINDVVGWVQQVIHTPVDFATNIVLNINDMRNTYTENQILKEQLASYKSLVYDVGELEKENTELREQVGLLATESIRSYGTLPATVVSRSPERWSENVTINKGKNHGVEANMLVMSSEGMVGKVQTAYTLSASVKLLSGFDQLDRVSAMIPHDNANIFGTIEGYDKESGFLVFRIIEDSGGSVEEGKEVFTSGMGGLFPAGIMIGKVKEIGSDQYGLTQIAHIEPEANLHEVSNVIVLSRDAIEPAISEEEETEEGQEE